jgi:transketolase
MMGIATGLSAAGKIPFVSTFAIFASGRAWEAVRQGIAYPRSNVKIVASHGGISVGEDGASHQMLEDIALMRVLPNMSVVIPGDAHQMVGIMETVVEYRGPVYIRMTRLATELIYEGVPKFEFGKGDVLREGTDVAIIGIGIMMPIVLQAAELLLKEGINAKVINMASVKPIDGELLVKTAEQVGKIVTVEEHSIIGGLGGAVAEHLSTTRPTKLLRLGMKDVFGQSGKAEVLFGHYGLDASGIAASIKSFVTKQ